MGKITLESLEELEFKIDHELKRSVYVLNEEGNAHIIVDRKGNVSIDIDGMSATANITDTEDIKQLITNFRDTEVGYPF